MKILLINPGQPLDAGWDQTVSIFRGAFYLAKPFSRAYMGLPLALPSLAAATPPGHRVRIVDEMIEPVDFDEDCDLVGITAMTFKATRAYEIADEFRRRGKPVVLGGIHASMCPEEAAEHADCVVVGEGEAVWPVLLEDFARGDMKPRYDAQGFPDVNRCGPPRYDLTRYRSYCSFSLQTTRGCPNACKFCTVYKFNGRRLRKKRIENILRELDGILKLKNLFVCPTVRDRKTGKKRKLVTNIFFTDDNFSINRAYALEICEALIRFQEERGILVNWYTQVDFRACFDDELLEAMKSAGCYSIFVGFESLSSDVLAQMNKKINTPRRYAEGIRNAHRHGLEVYASVIVGNDGDTPRVADEIAEFMEQNDIVYAFPCILTPFPGTDLYDEMKREGRIFDLCPEHLNIRNVVFEPASMAPEELQRAHARLVARLFDVGPMLGRAARLLRYPKRYYLTYPWRAFLFAWFMACTVLVGLRFRLPAAGLLRLLGALPRFVLRDGSLAALDYFVSTIEFNLFAASEGRRLPDTPALRRSRAHPGAPEAGQKEGSPERPGLPSALALGGRSRRA